jgi:hypothetical protein
MTFPIAGCTQRLRNPLALLTRQHDASKLLIHPMTVIKPQTILRDHIQLPSKCAPRLPVHRMCMTCRVNIRPRLVYGRVYRKGCSVDWLIAFDDVAGFVDEDEV